MNPSQIVQVSRTFVFFISSLFHQSAIRIFHPMDRRMKRNDSLNDTNLRKGFRGLNPWANGDFKQRPRRIEIVFKSWRRFAYRSVTAAPCSTPPKEHLHHKEHGAKWITVMDMLAIDPIRLLDDRNRDKLIDDLPSQCETTYVTDVCISSGKIAFCPGQGFASNLREMFQIFIILLRKIQVLGRDNYFHLLIRICCNAKIPISRRYL